MNGPVLVSAVLAGLAGASLLGPRPRLPTPPSPRARSDGRGLLIRYRSAWALLAALGAGTFLHGPLAVPAGLAAGIAVWVVASRAEPADVRRRREEAKRTLPHLVQLYAAALAAGAAPTTALEHVTAALPGPAADALRGVQARLVLGVPPGQVWAELASDPSLGPLGRTMARAHDSGAPVMDSVRALADDLAAEARADVEDRARTVGVRAAVPLGLCLLPSFLLLGIVPLVAGALAAIRW